MSEKLSVRRVDGPMLPQLHPFATPSPSPDIPRGTTSLVPMITPPLSQASSSSLLPDKEQFLLVPNPRNIVVRSMHHGRRVCVLVPEQEDVVIHAVSLVWLPRAAASNADDSEIEEDSVDEPMESSGEWVILAGCNDGSIQEWAVPSLLLSHSEYCLSLSMAETSIESGRKPRRIFQLDCFPGESDEDAKLTNLTILHLASPESRNEEVSNLMTKSRGGSLFFALVRGTTTETNEVSASWLVRCHIPQFARTRKETSSLRACFIVSVKTVPTTISNEKLFKLQSRHICVKQGDCVFGVLAAYRPSESAINAGTGGVESINANLNTGDVFVVICASDVVCVYHESAHSDTDAHFLDGVDEEFIPLVHFAPTKSDSSTVSSVSISPDVKDLVLGRSSGRIDLLDNLFDNIIEYLVKLKRKRLEKEKGDSSWSMEAVQHPQTSTVWRTLHWHTHPVAAVAFLTSSANRAYSSGSTKSLISGGEESVLATWQLDRNFHRPSHFLARVSQGGIIHTACCEHSGKIIISCADNSIHCYSGSNYDRQWVEQGLASIPLHEEDASSVNRGKPNGPIIMLKDPITNLLMLSNLPGAPGMIHWFDPNSASVVGVLEAAPYNRVSRRDRTKDPHIPVPAVTHMAMGKHGKDLVTVDKVWTENLSVGSSSNLVAPKGSIIPMNVCTSIKFWMYAETSKNSKSELSRSKRNSGDTPMNYVLVSSMAAPHGRDGTVCALDVAPDGNTACTLSQEENAFRIWVKNTDSSDVAFLWKCLYKVKTPSGFSNMLSNEAPPTAGQRLVSFSSDGSVLAVCYGPNVTLWDHSNATLLTSLGTDSTPTRNQTNEDIQEVHFMNKTDDTILLKTTSQISARSPFGGGSNRCYLGNDEWKFHADFLGDSAGTVSAVLPLPGFGGNMSSGGFFAVCITANNGAKSVISVVNREKGEVLCLGEAKKSPVQWNVHDEVQSLCTSLSSVSSLQMFAITKDCCMLSLNMEADGHIDNALPHVMKTSVHIESRSTAPLLKFAQDDNQPPLKRRKISIAINQRSEISKDYSPFEFPALSGKFTTAFISKHLAKSRNSSQ
ncbi:hypothetical protein HJC23_010578 [Cyclotella cryptica]|uniref:Uncharacterized protein n=1 Tax=Cyclotella cryptica TaxID=29204 RepID=A0ABD3PNV9_9STRA|eukprot:CCRYP_012770-RA/>CCRYP_012770-RA protein AED:0.18 eAED:0.18 QI:304/1/1/1/0.33/0.25/4/759/1068